MSHTIRSLGFVLLAGVPLILNAQTSTAEKVDQLRREIVEWQNKGEPGVNNLCFCTEVRSFGGFKRTLSNKLPKSLPVLIYYEPENLFTKLEDGVYIVDFVQDFVLMSADGEKELYRKNEMIRMQMATIKPLLDIYVTNNIDLTGLSPGKYTAKGLIHDRNREGSKPLEWRLSFELVDQ